MFDLVEVAIFILIGAVIGAAACAGIAEIGKDDCERNLPRTAKCVKQWMPEVKP